MKKCSFYSLLTLFTCVWCAGLSTIQADPPAPPPGQPFQNEGDRGNGNTSEGKGALFSLTSGAGNTAAGFDSLFKTTTGSDNTATGYQSLFNNISGNQNTVTGSGALFSNTTGTGYTAFGYQALYSINDGGAASSPTDAPVGWMTAIGYRALYNTTRTSGLTAVGYLALFNNTTGFGNTAVGWESLSANTTGSQNVGVGVSTLSSNTTGMRNTATGNNTMGLNTTGVNNTADGQSAMASNTTGRNNTASGRFALFSNTSGNANTADGANALSSNTTGGGNIAVGFGAGDNLDTGNNNIDIGNEGNSGESNTIRIGDQTIHSATFVAGIFGAATSGGVPVFVDGNGQLGTLPSSMRFKDDIKPMDKVSESILALQPVTFHYKPQIDKNSIPQFGLVAEDVAKVNPDLVSRDRQGKIYGVRYEAVNAMMLNELIKEHQKVSDLQTQVETLTAQLKEQAAVLQKVSNQVELLKAPTQTVATK